MEKNKSRMYGWPALAALGLVIASGAAIALWPHRGARVVESRAAPQNEADLAAPPAPEPASATLPRPGGHADTESRQVAAHPGVEALPPVVAAALQTPRAEPSPASRQVVAALSQLDLSRGPLTAEQVDAWAQSYRHLTELGPGAVPAIREFLDKNVDISLETASAVKTTGYGSLRLAMLDAMAKAGGPEAVPGLLQALQTTAIPAEIATIANYLEQTSPGAYGEAALGAARQALTLASNNHWEGGDVAPLFEVLTRFGGPTAAGELQAYAGKWFDYVPMALAQMPDNSGVPLLVQLAQASAGGTAPGGDICVRLLAGVAPQYPDAAETLLSQIKRIPDSAWPGISASLAGASLRFSASCLAPAELAARPDARAYHIVMGNQNFVETLPPADMSLSEVNDRVRLIDQLLGSTTSPAAIEALKSARTTLAARSGQ
jgi:hypothetical protein